jgi:hypothetical protein
LALPEPDPSSQRFEQLRAEQVAALYRNAVPGTVGAVVAALILTGMLVLLGSVSLVIGATFIALNVAHASGRLWLVRAYRRARPLTTAWRRWGLRMSISAVVGGLTWGLGSLLLLDRAHPELQLMVFLVCASLASGAITAFGTYLPAYYGTLFSSMCWIILGACYIKCFLDNVNWGQSRVTRPLPAGDQALPWERTRLAALKLSR